MTMPTVRELRDVFTKSFEKWNDHNGPRLSAAVAFYTILSLAPLLVLTVAITALVVGQNKAEGELLTQAHGLVGAHGARVAKNLLANSQQPASGIFASVIAIATLLFGASGVFGELKDALNVIWESNAKVSSSAIKTYMKRRLLSFGMVLAVGFLLLVSLIASAAVNILAKFFAQLIPVPPLILESFNFVFSFGVTVVLFALIFKFVPDVKVEWGRVWVGAIVTALLFTLGKSVLGIYLGRASVGSAYGAAGSLVAMIVWVYYSAQIFFFGAEFTHAYAEKFCPLEAAPESKPLRELRAAAHN